MKIQYLLLILSVLLLFACSDNEKPEGDLTFIVYMAADNSLSEYALLDICQMEMADFDPSRVNVIVQADFLYTEDNPACRRWRILPDGINDEIITSPVIEELGEIDSGDWHSLTDFYNWAVDEYPAQNYVLSIWSHGNDWYSYSSTPNHFCPDHESSSWFDIPGKDLQQAFRHFNCEPDLVILDACNMQSLEVLAEIAGDTDRICSSTDIVPSLGFPYHDILTSLSADLPAAINYDVIPHLYVDSYLPFMGSQNYQGEINQPVGASMIKSEVLSDSLLVMIADLVDYALNNTVAPEVFLAARAQCYEFNDLEMNVDLFQFVSFLMEEEIDSELYNICSGIKALMFINRDYYNYPSYDLANILVTFPETANRESWNNLQEQYRLLDFHLLTGWADFINWLISGNVGYI
jgi:hypothetical protein